MSDKDQEIRKDRIYEVAKQLFCNPMYYIPTSYLNAKTSIDLAEEFVSEFERRYERKEVNGE